MVVLSKVTWILTGWQETDIVDTDLLVPLITLDTFRAGYFCGTCGDDKPVDTEVSDCDDSGACDIVAEAGLFSLWGIDCFGVIDDVVYSDSSRSVVYRALNPMLSLHAMYDSGVWNI